MKPKINRKGDATKSNVFDRCNTPAYAVTPLLPFIKKEWLIWEPACGTGNIMDALEDNAVIGTDILTGTNFFESELRGDAIITNPPYSIKYEWLRRCYDFDVPFALLVPVETIGAKRAQDLMKQHGCELLLLNRRVNFEMPNVGYSGGGAQFPVLWFCHKLLPEKIMYGDIIR